MTSIERTPQTLVRTAPVYAPIPRKSACPKETRPVYPKRRFSPRSATAYAMNGSISRT